MNTMIAAMQIGPVHFIGAGPLVLLPYFYRKLKRRRAIKHVLQAWSDNRITSDQCSALLDRYNA